MEIVFNLLRKKKFYFQLTEYADEAELIFTYCYSFYKIDIAYCDLQNICILLRSIH